MNESKFSKGDFVKIQYGGGTHTTDIAMVTDYCWFHQSLRISGDEITTWYEDGFYEDEASFATADEILTYLNNIGTDGVMFKGQNYRMRIHRDGLRFYATFRRRIFRSAFLYIKQLRDQLSKPQWIRILEKNKQLPF